jgi:hypothetical protein
MITFGRGRKNSLVCCIVSGSGAPGKTPKKYCPRLPTTSNTDADFCDSSDTARNFVLFLGSSTWRRFRLSCLLITWLECDKDGIIVTQVESLLQMTVNVY